MGYCIVNGRLLPEEQASIPIQDRGFRYGDGVFETIPVHEAVPYQYDWHIQRLEGGLEALRIPFSTEALRAYCRQLLEKNAIREGMLRIQVTRGVGSKGYLPDGKHPQAGANYVIEAAPMPDLPWEPVTLWQSRYTKIPARALPIEHKLCQGLNSTLARMEANDHGCFDALLLNDRGAICETSSGNIFWIRNGHLYTPSPVCGLLAGATRAAIMRLSPFPVEEVEVPLSALRQAEGVFITNSIWQSIPVNRILPGQWVWDSTATAQIFKHLLAEDRDKHSRSATGQW